MVVKNPIGLIGDTLGTFPVLQQLNRDHENFSVIVNEEVKWLYDLVPEIAICTCPKWDKELNVNQAFKMANMHSIYMVQSYYPFMGYSIPAEPVRADLTIKDVNVHSYDYVIAPYGRSAPETQKLGESIWIDLMQMMPDKSFCVLGNSRFDKEFSQRPANLYYEFDRSAQQLANILLKAKKGCVSIVTGISHFCYHLDVKNYLITNQTGMTWGENPSAICIREHIPTLTAKFIYDRILEGN